MRRSLLELKALPDARKKKMSAVIDLPTFETFFEARLVADPRFQQKIRSLFDEAIAKDKKAVLTVTPGSWIGKQQSVEMLIDTISRKILLQVEDQELQSQYQSMFSQFDPDKHVLLWLVNVPFLHEDKYYIPEDFQHRLSLLNLPKSPVIDVPSVF